jgi:soluble epoxide hydrolase/lipid-phosphate phosphatase
MGYSVCTPDMRGYGQSWVPSEVKDYSFQEANQDLLNLLKVFKREKAVFIGHDIGGAVVWSMALHHQSRCLGVIVLNTPLVIAPASKEVVEAGGPISLMKRFDAKTCGHFDYQAYFQDHGDDELNADVERTVNAYFRAQVSGDRDKDKANMRLGMRTNYCRVPKSQTDPSYAGVLAKCPPKIPRDPLWSESEIQFYVDNFKRTGFPLKWYRAFDANWRWDIADGAKQITIPSLLVTAEYDAVLNPESSRGMEALIPGLERKHVVCGHWTMIERKDQVNALLRDVLTRRIPPGIGAAAKL